MLCLRVLPFIGVIVLLGVPAARSQTSFSTTNEIDQLNNIGFEHVAGNKYAVIVNSLGTLRQAFQSCRSILPGASLFRVNSAEDSQWLGERINLEKNLFTRASKFWLGLFSRGANGPLGWSDGSKYIRYPEVVQESGFDDASKRFAWAVPDGLNKLKYEFLTDTDEAEAFICQYLV